jgi:hypothetical protein
MHVLIESADESFALLSGELPALPRIGDEIYLRQKGWLQVIRVVWDILDEPELRLEVVHVVCITRWARSALS